MHRWIKFEEDVEEAGERWSKPHVATLQLHVLHELRDLLHSDQTLLMLNLDEVNAIEQIAGAPRETMSYQLEHLMPLRLVSLGPSSSSLCRLCIVLTLNRIWKFNEQLAGGRDFDNFLLEYYCNFGVWCPLEFLFFFSHLVVLLSLF